MISKARPDPDTSLTLRRTYEADRERIFRAWTDPEALRRWFCPVNFEVAVIEVDLREGGNYRLGMRDPEGGVHVTTGTYREIRPPERLVFSWRWEGGEMEETLVTVEFHARGGSTEVVLTHELFPTPELRDQHMQGWQGCLENLAGALPGLT